METTPFLAIWGAIISTITATWNIIQGLQNKRRLTLEVFIGHMSCGDPEKLYICFIITNIGRRPIYITGIYGIDSRNKGIFIVPRGLPKMLKESENHFEFSDDFSIFDKDIKEIYVLDSTKKKWKLKKKALKKFIKEGKEILKNQKDDSKCYSAK